jgi:hypothetical protein
LNLTQIQGAFDVISSNQHADKVPCGCSAAGTRRERIVMTGSDDALDAARETEASALLKGATPEQARMALATRDRTTLDAIDGGALFAALAAQAAPTKALRAAFALRDRAVASATEIERLAREGALRPLAGKATSGS